MIALYIFLAILLFLFLLTLPPVHIAVSFQDRFTLQLRYLFLRKTFRPQEEPEPEPPPEESAEEKPKSKLSPDLKRLLTRRGLSGFLQALGEALSLLGRCSRRLIRRLRLRQFDLYLCLAGGGDAAGAALLYGKVAGGVYAACGGLFTLMPCREKGVTVDLDFDGEQHRVVFSARVSMRPVFLIKEGLVLLIRGFPPVRRMLRILTPPKPKPAPPKSAASE